MVSVTNALCATEQVDKPREAARPWTLTVHRR
jgi:hypothetical protein